jgi:hypothetical protein
MSSTAPSDYCRGIVDFRDTVVGHILDKDTSGLLTSREIDERLERVIAGNREDFLRGINNTTAKIGSAHGSHYH